MNSSCQGDFFPILSLYRCLLDGAWSRIEGEGPPAVCPHCGRPIQADTVDEAPVRLLAQVQHPTAGWLDLPVAEEPAGRVSAALEAVEALAEAEGEGVLSSVLASVALLWMMGMEDTADALLGPILVDALKPPPGATLEKMLSREASS